MSLLLFVAGVVGVVLPEYFKGQHSVGVALLVIAAVIIVLNLIVFGWIANKVKGSRYRRGFR